MVSFTAIIAVSAAVELTVAAPTYSNNTAGEEPEPSKHHDTPLRDNGILVQLGPRPYYLVDDMEDSYLKEKLDSCKNEPKYTSGFSISHRGAPLEFPEHSRQGYDAAARMGAGIIECDVSFTMDKELVCRHSNCDLHYTTNILSKPELAAKCTEPFTPANPDNGTEASAKCCTSDITLAEYKMLCAEMEATTFDAISVNISSPYFGRIGITPDWRTNMYSYSCAEPMSLKEQIEQVDAYSLNFTAEAKTPEVSMPFTSSVFKGNYTQQDFIQQIVDTFDSYKIDPKRVWLQSSHDEDIFYWVDNTPAYGEQAVYLDERADVSANGYEEAVASLPGLAERGVKIMAPPIYQLITASNSTGEIVPSTYATTAKEVGLELFTWSFERSGPLSVASGGYYYSSISNLITRDGDEYKVIDAIVQKVGVTKIFADWCSTVTYYANCFGL